MNDTTSMKPKVLIVDDTQLNQKILDHLLRDGYINKLASNGLEALEAARTFHPDVILLDVNMPGIDGYEVCRQLKSDARTRDIPVIFITAMTDERDEELGFSVGGSDYIQKPIRGAIVKARISAHLKIKFMQDYLRQEKTLLETANQQSFVELEQLRTYLWGGELVRG